jgi:hypothetical protein
MSDHLTPEQIRADQAAFAREQQEAHQERREAFRPLLYHAMRQARQQAKNRSQGHTDERR